MKIKRNLRAVAGEMGEFDRVVLFESLRDRKFIYQCFPGETCLIETDSEPPLPLNKDALEISLQIATMLHCDIPEEVHIMRKTVIDGSNTSGFQRTTVVGLGGWVKGFRGKIGILQICLEEEAAGIVKRKGSEVTYRLDRLGIPLVEISTGILEGYTPEQVGEFSYYLGLLLRSTGKMMRGIGSIRQDVNVSIRGGARVEIKGIQELGVIPKVIKNEASRQKKLLEIKKKLKRVRIPAKVKDVTRSFRRTKSKLIKKILAGKGSVFAFKLPKFKGLLKEELMPGKTLGGELASYAQAYDVKGLIHSDENLTKYRLTKEFDRLSKSLRANKNDSIVIIAGEKNKAKIAAEAVSNRCRQLQTGVPEEVRSVNPDGTTMFTRPLPGAARLYPETDIPPITITKSTLKDIKKKLPKPVFKKIKEYRKLGLSDSLTKNMLMSSHVALFERFKRKIDPVYLASVLTGTTKAVEREIRTEINAETIERILVLLSKKLIPKEGVEILLKKLTFRPARSEEIIKKLRKEMLSIAKLRKMIRKTVRSKHSLIKKLGPDALKPLMGVVMKKVRGRIGGKIVYAELKKELKKHLR